MWLVNQLTAGADSIGGWIFLILASAFWIWMFVDSIRREEYFWAVLMVIFSFLTALFYYFFVYRQAAPAGGRGFELPGAKTRKRIKELQAQIHHLDKAHLHSQLGDVYLEQGSLAKAEASYRAALERDAEDPDTRAHLGQCLLRQGRVKEALALLEPVCAENPKHEYGQTMMALAEAQRLAGQKEQSLASWRYVNSEHSYTRARVQLAELLIERGETPEARQLLTEVLAEHAHTPAFQQKKDKVWVDRARSLSRKYPA